jgi:hypothetical protein
MADTILRHTMELPDKNALVFFYNATSGLLVIDVLDAGGDCGNEIVRRRLDMDALLGPARKFARSGKADQPSDISHDLDGESTHDPRRYF